jgi:pentatricopeptide repeat protein
MVGRAYCLNGRWKDAKELFMRVMETRKRMFGEGHPHTLSSMGKLSVGALESRQMGRG